MRVLFGAGLVVGAGLLPFGCKSDEPNAEYELFYADYMHAVCAKAVRCCKLPGYDFSNCPSELGDPFLSELDAADPNAVAFHADRAQACLDAVRATADD